MLNLIDSKYQSQIEILQDTLSTYRLELFWEIYNASSDVLAKEHNLTELYMFACEQIEKMNDLEQLVIDDSPEITFAILFSQRTRASQVSVSTRYIKEETGFGVGKLIDLFENAEELKKRVHNLEIDIANVSRKFESLGCKPTTVNSILSDAQKMVSEL